MMRARRVLSGAGLALLLCAAGTLWAFSARAEDGPVLRGYSSQFIYLKPLGTDPPVQFPDGAGQPVDFGQFQGKVVLANLWATWCAPCVRELPDLDRLQAELGGDRFAVVAIARDLAGLEAVAPFFRRYGLTHLQIYLDPSHRTVYTDAANAKRAAFALYALPISYLVDARGQAIGYLKGAADWISPEAQQFLRHFIAEADGDRK